MKPSICNDWRSRPCGNDCDGSGSHGECAPNKSPVCPKCSMTVTPVLAAWHAGTCDGLASMPPVDLTLVPFGWAPGSYMVRCRDCQVKHIADNLASRCELCAQKARDAAAKPLAVCYACDYAGATAVRTCGKVDCPIKARFAQGGTVVLSAPGGWATVGERAPDLVRVPAIHERGAPMQSIPPRPIDRRSVDAALKELTFHTWRLSHPWTARLEPSDQRQAYEDFKRKEG